ncbi:hypothetical protein BDV38DRAFT_166023 [Aspergillus pseudotamarii]|uniref:Uncharacterized protein n=1 Tax=Aspergillus pseudotamarii TaxID=132259 RepID=A0A5N6SKG0_ASPPS|nr:uncharacterized protein BDV38DRAFT_166023 [Aspergillus pseudotamarii]KAE8134240.1 hypothetical protein BDV38DRAFT_166023 [Aspergillus pseudotamarii]
MQVAEILSDLTSLRVCDYNDALALVTVHQRIPAERSPADGGLVAASQQGKKANDDLRRAKELVDLHYEIKARHADGTVDQELACAREDVNRVLRELGH